ncbi:ATP-dependent DNA helicase [Bordetella pertussis]|uniref:DNA 3'-5' helicase n=85 Tax=Bordetella pertussis TaxID=520 RepID=Q7VX41_BORPE|nr:ATP-dependent helicase [Bordetella pertussis]AEE67270.1 ATP-dependent DNA helicase [Bordetella pertussis CS]AIW92144.1 ATP-dependent DNA helicase [Bordetella pertussis B1917]AIW95752.1 ATP-dependent DNA helicase [Bordetella pertussis B1920]AJB26248.1 ATP-dependent DNA helicase [Bordetella pertussis 137]ALH49436.1 ATP-dependent DNA helicase [Bordetella pertussis]
MSEPVSRAPAPADDPLAELNPAQREAAAYGVDAPASQALLVIAGAGSGKTNTLAHRVAHLILHGADPQRMLLLTFSRRAAQEMERRVGGVLQRVMGLRAGHAAPALPWAGTFHSVGARLLRDCAPRIGLSEAFTVHDRGDAEDLMGIVRHELGLSATHNRFPLKGTCLAIYSRVVNSQAPLAEVLRQAFPWCEAWEAELKRLFQAYVLAKQEQNVLDYDDLLLYWAEMMRDAGLAADVGARFDHILVDEYQDTNRLQAAILLAMKPDGGGLTVVGDDAQSIYSFRAASVRNILDFPQQFPGGAKVVTLERNYRSTQPILDASNAVIGLAAERYAKALWTDRASSQRPELVSVSDEAGQARWVADQVLAQREGGATLKSQAALFRASSHSAALELELTRRNIPFVKFGGLRFLEAAHVKDMLSVLRWAENPRSRLAGFRVAQLVPGIGPATAGKLMDAMAQAADPLAAMREFQPGAAARQQWSEFVATYATLREARRPWPADVDAALQWYGPQLERIFDDARVRRADLEQLARLAGGYPTRERFLTELTLDPPDATSDESGPPLRDEDYMILSTIHSAKGQEWKSVYILNAVDGCMPSDMATGTAEEIEEERRLLYVAMTRARERLQVVVPQRFYVHQQAGLGDRHVYGSRTRFISEAMLPLFEHLPKPPELPFDRARPIEPAAPRIDVVSRVRGLFS